MSKRKLASGAPHARRDGPERAEGLPWWCKALAYDRDGNVIELRAEVWLDGIELHCGPAGTPVASGARKVRVRFVLTPSEARAFQKAFGRCVDASSAVVLEV